MAFSAFRLMMGAGASSGPVVLTDTITPEVASLVQNQTLGLGGNPTYSLSPIAVISPTNSKLGIYSKARNFGSGYTWIYYEPATQSGGPSMVLSTGKALSVGPNPASSTVDIAWSSGNGICAIDDESNSMTCNYIDGTPSISATTSHNMGQASTAIRACMIGTYTATFAVLADTTSHMYLFDSSQYYSTATGPTDVSTGAQIISLTSTLGVLVYLNSSNVIKYTTFNLSSSTISIDSAVSTSITAASGGKIVPIDSTHMLLVYKKSSNTLAARVVTVATGSSFTLNTEYTVTATGITDDPIGNPGEFTSSGDYGVTWINANGQGCCTLMSVSGTTVTLSNPNIYHTANDLTATSNYYSSYFIGTSSTQAFIAYTIKLYNINSSSSTIATKVMRVDLNFDTVGNSWNSSYTGNVKSITSLLSAANGLDMCSFGTDRYLCMQTQNNTTVTFSTVDNDYSIALTNAQNTFTAGGSTQAGTIINIGFSGTTARALAIYGYSNTTVEARLVQLNTDGGTITIGAASTVTSSGTQTAYYTINAINYATDKTLVFYLKSTGLYAAIITTSGTSISSVANETQILSNTATNINLGLTLLDSSGNIMLGYCNNGAGTSSVMIVNVSGTSITVGTSVGIGTTTNVQGPISSCLHTSSRGSFCFYDSPSGTPDVYVQGFTYSGTTITLGAAAHNVSQWGSGINSATGYKTQILSVGNNDAQVIFATNSSTMRSRMITASAINTYTIGTQFGPSTGGANYAFLPQDNFNKATLFSGGTVALFNFYRV